MYDNIEKFHRTVIHHGPHNSRIYLMKMYEAEASDIIQAMDEMAQEKGYGKILAKVPGALNSFFEQRGYGEEATIPGFSRGQRCSNDINLTLFDTHRVLGYT